MPNPIKPNFKTECLPVFLLALTFIASFYFYLHFPERIVTHWNAAGQPNGYSSKAFAAFFFPFFNIGIYLLLFFVPYIDPKKSNYNKFKNIYHIIKSALVVFLTVLYMLVVLNGLGYKMPINIAVPLSVAFLFIIIGVFLERIKPNWFIGIRTPWTLSSDIVWQKTHKFGSKVFILGGFLMLLAAVLPQWFSWFIGLFILMVLITIIYSYLLYRKH